ncbi:hypothetical protein [Priestia aryabhattai]|uniref:hypothetical protein n=1 Tax=Priestia aryabhattai TaxID=412384 RepID=UPI001CD027F8|nr:hypothetical protein [Priestia aryabhattai]MBZ6485063.1 hypothetical protein [Priestia aryabhattai]
MMRVQNLFLKSSQMIIGTGGILQVFQMLFPKQFVVFINKGKEFIMLNWLSLVIICLLTTIIVLLNKDDLPPTDGTPA